MRKLVNILDKPDIQKMSFSISPDILHLERAARVWCRSENESYEMQPGICYSIAILLKVLEAVDKNLRPDASLKDSLLARKFLEMYREEFK